MSTETKIKTRTITLTDQGPVKIREDEWPIVAHGSHHNHNNEYEYQANCIFEIDVRVRQHADGRAIVYGVCEYESGAPYERNVTAKAGVLLGSGADLVEAIREVGATIAAAITEAEHGEYVQDVSSVVRDCIADLPAQEI